MGELINPTPSFSKVLGLSDKDFPLAKEGETWLKTAQNIDINDQNEWQLREGFALLDSATYHSLGGTAQIPLVVRNNDLVLITKVSPASFTTLISGVENSPMVYTSFWNRVYYTNNHRIGYIKNLTNYSPTPDLPAFKRRMVPGHLINSFQNHLLVARDNTILISDAFAPLRYDERKAGIILKDRVTLLETLKEGILTSDGSSIFFYEKTERGFRKHVKANYGAVEGTSAKMNKVVIKDKSFEEVIFLRTHKGICIAYDGGGFENVTESRREIDKVSKGVGFIRKGTFNQYVTNATG